MSNKIKDEIAIYRELRTDAMDNSNSLSKNAVEFYKQLLKMNSFINKIPNDIGYRKNKIKSSVNMISQLIEQLKNELQLLDTDCTIQIYRLIAIYNKNKEKRK